jgi:hypothetical protein
MDCSNRKRVKDAAGHYMCAECFESRNAAKLVPATASAGSSEPSVSTHNKTDEEEPFGLAPIDGDLSPPKACPRCGSLVNESAKICIQCGVNLRTGQAPAAPEQKIPRKCKACGYDLRGLPLECDCPECGEHNLPPKLKNQDDEVRRRKENRAYYVRPLRAGIIGLVGLVIIRLAGQEPMMLMLDGAVIGLLVPLGLVAYFLFSTMWAGGFDQGWGLAALNLFAIMAISQAVSAGAGYVPIPMLPRLFSFIVYIMLLQKFMDLEDWKDALIFSVILTLIQWFLVLSALTVFMKTN